MVWDKSNVDIHAKLVCELDGCPISISCSNQAFIVEVPDVVSGLKLFRLGSRGLTRHHIHQIKQFLDKNRSFLSIAVAGKTIGSIGYQIGSNWWNLFGLPKLNLNLSQLLWLAIKASFSSKSINSRKS